MPAAQQLKVPYLHGLYVQDNSLPTMMVASTEAVVLSPTTQGLADFQGKVGWSDVDRTNVRPWTDDYVNLIGAMWRQSRPPAERP